MVCLATLSITQFVAELSDFRDMVEEKQTPPTVAQKELMKWVKKLREIRKMEEQLASGIAIDPLQKIKLQKRDEVASKAMAAREKVMEERRLKREQREASSSPRESSTPAEETESVTVTLQMRQDGTHSRSLVNPSRMRAADTARFGNTPAKCGGKEALAISEPSPLPTWQSKAFVTSYTSVQDALKAGGEERAEAIEAFRGTVWPRSLDAAGCWDVQLALELLDRRTASELVLELHGHVREAVKSPHANYVLQKVIVVMTPLQAAFIVEELFDIVADAAKHRYGCRILCRLVEHFTGDAALTVLLDKLLAKPGELCSHPFAHHVLESVLEHGLEKHKQKVCWALVAHAPRIAANRHGSFVIEAALESGLPDVVEALAMSLLSAGPEGLCCIAQTPFGTHVVRVLANVPGESSQSVKSMIESKAATLGKNRHGQQLLRDLGLPSTRSGAFGQTAASGGA